MDVTIRRARKGDGQALAIAGQATFLETYAEVLPVSDILLHFERHYSPDAFEHALADPDDALWLAEVAATRSPVGFALICPPDLPVTLEPGDLELKRIYLLHRFHGAGVGAKLMAASVEEARARGAPRLLLGVYNANEGALAFYARQGFVRVGVRKFQVGANVYDDLVLAKSL